MRSIQEDLNQFATFGVKSDDDFPPAMVNTYIKNLKTNIKFLDPDDKLAKICMDLSRYDLQELCTLSLNVFFSSFLLFSSLLL